MRPRVRSLSGNSMKPWNSLKPPTCLPSALVPTHSILELAAEKVRAPGAVAACGDEPALPEPTGPVAGWVLTEHPVTTSSRPSTPALAIRNMDGLLENGE